MAKVTVEAVSLLSFVVAQEYHLGCFVQSKEEVMAVRLREADNIAAMAELQQQISELEIQVQSNTSPPTALFVCYIPLRPLHTVKKECSWCFNSMSRKRHSNGGIIQKIVK